jgi:predicted MFS family arabinose efflux permease
MQLVNAEAGKKFTSYQVFVIVLLSLTQFTVILDFMIISPLGDMLIKSMNLTPTRFGISVASYALMAGFSGFLTAGFADRYDRKKLLLFFYTGFIIGSMLCGLAASYLTLLTARIVTGFFGGVISSVSIDIVADIFPIRQRGRVTGFVQMGFAASQVLGVPIGLYIANRFNWQAPFFLIAAFSTLIWAAIAAKLTPIVQHLEADNDRSAFMHLWHTLSRPAYRTAFLTTALITLGGGLLIPWASPFAINNLGVSQVQLPVLFMVTGISSLLIMPLVGKLSDTVSKLGIYTVDAGWAILSN